MKPTCTNIHQWDNGRLIARYATSTEAAQAIAATRPETRIRSIRESILKALGGQRDTAYGYQWTTNNQAPEPAHKESKYTSIHQWDNGRLIALYANSIEAAQAIAATHPKTRTTTIRLGILNVLRGQQRTAYGYQWTTSEQAPEPVRTKYTKYTDIHQWAEGRLIARYANSIEAAQAIAPTHPKTRTTTIRLGILNVLRGQQRTAYGYQWTTQQPTSGSKR